MSTDHDDVAHDEPSDRRMGGCIEEGECRLWDELRASAPFTAPRVASWVDELFDGARLSEMFMHPSAFPVIPLPWWAEESLSAPVDIDRHEALACSSMAGYLYIRLIDNVMDDDAPADRRLLPALTFFSNAFIRPYREWFGRAHPFWDDFERFWVGTADATVQDAYLEAVDLDAFRSVSARKTEAAMVPVAAFLHLHGRVDRMDAWQEFVAGFGRWHQLLNDLRGWARDTDAGRATFVLSEAACRRREGEPVAGWILREGLDWAVGTLAAWMADLRALAARIGSPGLNAYLAMRQDMLDAQARAARTGAKAALRLTAVLEEATVREER